MSDEDNSSVRATFTWCSVPYKQNDVVYSDFFTIKNHGNVQFRIKAHRAKYLNNNYVLHIQVQQISQYKYAKADVTITINNLSFTYKTSCWSDYTRVFCFCESNYNNKSDIKCDITWYGFIKSEEAKRHILTLDSLVWLTPRYLFSSIRSDVTLRIGYKLLYAHKVILSEFSPIICAMVKTDPKNTSARSQEVCIPDVEFAIMTDILRFMYTGKLTHKIDTQRVARVLVAADKYQIDMLKTYCSDKLCRNLKINNVISILDITSECNTSEFHERAMKFLVDHIKYFDVLVVMDIAKKTKSYYKYFVKAFEENKN
ncbi:uncharacterized protein LOC103570281 [Microplitis demolitor]|uniref:uncharacterized protein LOC103570281 n=1 Tax=Microplitis demolitor TaxID=69319 RepID=UPI00043FFFFA|nr:uncharacterized protein LOC103570281 [Microplitis demolitor]